MEREIGSKELSFGSQVKKQCISFFASVQEGCRYLKAFVLGQVKNVRAKDEKEASLAELEVSKMQVEATEEAERKKNSLGQ